MNEVSTRVALRSLALVLAPLVIVALVVVGWRMWSARIAADVAVGWSWASPTCTGTSVRDLGSQGPIIVATPTMRCVITVEVTNGSGRTVRLDRAVAPYVGPDTGTVVTAPEAQPATESEVMSQIDGVFPLGRTVGAGETTAFEIVLVFRPEGCVDSATITVERWPTVTVEALGRSFERSADRTFAFEHRGRTPGCSD